MDQDTTAAGSERAVRFDGNGNYLRAADGTWHYADGEPVPGSRDLLLADVYPAPAVGRSRRQERHVPRRWLQRRSEHPLAWMLELADAQAREHAEDGTADDVVIVSASVWLRHADDVVGMLAPELHPSALLGVADVAALLGVSPATVRAYLHRRQMPPPVTRISDTPAWSRPIIERWLRTRRRPSRPGAAGGAGA